MIRGGAVISASMLAIGALYASGASSTPAGRWTIIVLIYIFVVGFSCSWAIVIRIIVGEIQPTKTRASVSSFGQCVNWVRLHVSWLFLDCMRTSCGYIMSTTVLESDDSGRTSLIGSSDAFRSARYCKYSCKHMQ